MLYFYCDECSEVLESPDSLKGESIACPKCGWENVIENVGHLKERIEKLESGRLQANYSRINQMKAAGVKDVRWVSSRDEHVCKFCKSMEGVVMDINDALEYVEGSKCHNAGPLDGCRCCFVANVETPGKSD